MILIFWITISKIILYSIVDEKYIGKHQDGCGNPKAKSEKFNTSLNALFLRLAHCTKQFIC